MGKKKKRTKEKKETGSGPHTTRMDHTVGLFRASLILDIKGLRVLCRRQQIKSPPEGKSDHAKVYVAPFFFLDGIDQDQFMLF